MKEKTQNNTPEPVLHRLLFGNGKFITPSELRIMHSLGIIPAAKT